MTIMLTIKVCGCIQIGLVKVIYFEVKNIKFDPWGKMSHPDLSLPSGVLLVSLFLNVINRVIIKYFP